MFTGIIKAMGKVVVLRKKSADITILTVKNREIADISDIGDSIAVNGVCLTVVSIQGDTVSFDLSTETLKSSNMEALVPASQVNLEPAIRADERFGGHFVTGHIDATGCIKSKTEKGESLIIAVEAPENVLRYLVKKGSIAIDGISLTIVDLSDTYFTIVVIPHTVSATTIGIKGVGDSVNLEADIIGKYVEKFTLQTDNSYNRDTDKSFLKKLREEGYMV